MKAASFSRLVGFFLLKSSLQSFSYLKDAKLIVISAQNLRSAGGLSVLLQVLAQLKDCRTRIHVICFASSSKIIPSSIVDQLSCTIVPLPLSSKSWLARIYYEYIGFFVFSLHLDIDVWLALNDLSPFVKAKKRILLFHNAILFWKPPLAELFSSINVCIAWLAYKLLVPVNIHANNFVVAQAYWVKDALQSMFRLSDSQTCVIKSHPELPLGSLSCVDKLHNVSSATHPKLSARMDDSTINSSKDSSYKLVFPSFPRPFKNLPRLMAAVYNLYRSGLDVSLHLTFDKKTNLLARRIIKNFPGRPFHYYGFLPKDDLVCLYSYSNALIFPSTLETLGLPLIEYTSICNKPILASDLPYAIEALSDCQNKILFDPFDIKSIECAILECINKESASPLPINSPMSNLNACRTNAISGWAQVIDLAFSS